MPAVRSWLVLIFLAAHVCRAGEVPDPLFWPSETAFLKQVSDGEFDAHIDLHLLQYAADPRWPAEWAAQRYAGSGLFAEYGSTTSNDLHVNSQVAVNLFPSKRFQVRYDRRDYQDGRFDVSDQRFGDLSVEHSSPGWVLGGRVTGVSLERSQDAETTGSCSLSRSWSRVTIFARKDLARCPTGWRAPGSTRPT